MTEKLGGHLAAGEILPGHAGRSGVARCGSDLRALRLGWHHPILPALEQLGKKIPAGEEEDYVGLAGRISADTLTDPHG
jgi:hypothetical protein